MAPAITIYKSHFLKTSTKKSSLKTVHIVVHKKSMGSRITGKQTPKMMQNKNAPITVTIVLIIFSMYTTPFDI